MTTTTTGRLDYATDKHPQGCECHRPVCAFRRRAAASRNAARTAPIPAHDGLPAPETQGHRVTAIQDRDGALWLSDGAQRFHPVAPQPFPASMIGETLATRAREGITWWRDETGDWHRNELQR